MVRENRIKEYNFSVGSLTAGADGLLNVYSEWPINGTIQNIVLASNTFTTTGSLLVFASGLTNSGTSLGELIVTLRAGSSNQDYYPIAYGALNQAIFLSGTTGASFIQKVINSTVRVVGSGLGTSTSGIGLSLRYI